MITTKASADIDTDYPQGVFPNLEIFKSFHILGTSTQNSLGGFPTVKLLLPVMLAPITSNFWPIGNSSKNLIYRPQNNRKQYIELHSAYIFKNFANFATE